MLDRNNLNRIKGILSARQGAEVPKFNSGAKFAKSDGRSFIYSSGDGVWFTDENLTMPYNGDFAGFSSIEYNPNTKKNPLYNPSQPQTEVPGNPTSTPVQTAIPGAPQVTPTSAVEQVAQNAAVTLKKEGPLSEEEFKNGTRIAPVELDREAVNASLNKMGPIKQTELVGVDELQQQKRAEIMQKEEKNTKALNTFGSLTSAALQGIGAVVGANQQASDSNTTKTIDSAYSTVAEGIKQAGPVGQAIGTAMQVGKVAGDLIQSLGGGTDQQTAADKWMDSALFSWNIGMINGFAGEKTQDFGMDTSAVEQVGGSYGGSVSAISEASEKAGKKYGLFSSKAREKANKAIDLARSQQRVMGNIADTAASQRLAVQSMGEQAGLAYSMMTNGGYDQKYTYAAKQGGALEWNPMIELNWNPSIEVTWEPQIELNWDLSEFKEGGTIDINEELEWIPELQSGNAINLDEVRKYYKDYDLSNVEFIIDESPRTEGNKLYISNDEDAVHELWHYLSNNQPNEVYKDYYHDLDDERIAELGGNLKFVKQFDLDPGHFYHPSELEARIRAAKFKTQGQAYTKEFFQNLRKEENKYGNNMRDLLYMYNDDNLVKIFSLKTGGKIEEEYPQEYIDFIDSVAKHAPNLRAYSPEGYRMFRFWQLRGKPKNWEEAMQQDMFILQDDGSYHAPSIAWNENGEGEWLKHTSFPTAWMEKAFYDGYDFERDPETGEPIFSDSNPLYEGVRPKLIPLTGQAAEESKQLRENYTIVEGPDGYRKYIPKQYKKGGSIGNYDIPETEETNQKNVIPEGALHKNKHHMEHAEGLTKKGIPVIDDDGDQQAEIEHSEIIFTLEVTKKLEEYYKIFYSDESSNNEKEQAALDAGKLLVYQILENTEDRTGLIDSCKKGGTLTLKKSTDDLIEEALSEDMSVVVIEEHTEKRPIKKTKETSEKEQIKELIKEALIELILK